MPYIDLCDICCVFIMNSLGEKSVQGESYYIVQVLATP